MSALFPSKRDFMDLNRNFFGDSFDRLFNEMNTFNVDIKESDDAYELEADLPGLTKEDVKLDYKDNVLSIEAYKEEKAEKEDKDRNYIRRERSTRSYSRQFIFKDIDEDNISAKFDKGVLTIELPKKDKTGTESKRIEIN